MSSPSSEGAAPALGADQLLAGLSFLDVLPGELAALIRDSFEARSYAFGDAVFREGDLPDALYVVRAGRARVLRDGTDGDEVALNLLEPGTTFGEAAVFYGSRRSATVRASSPELVVLRLDGALLRALARRHPELERILGSVAVTHAVADRLRASPLFASLPRAELAPLVERAHEIELAAGEIAFAIGDAPSHAYLVREGRLAVSGERDLGTMTPGDVFGERGVLLSEPRAATVTALEPARLLCIDGQQLKQLVDTNAELREQIDARLRRYERRGADSPADPAAEVPPAPAADAEAELAAAAARDAGELEPVDATVEPRRRRRRRFRIIHQIDERDCGAACLAMLCRHYGHDVSLSFIRQSAGTTIDGTSLQGLKRGGAAIGIEMRLVKSSADAVDALALPAVIHWGGRHWVILTAVAGDTLRLADPGPGARTCTREELAKEWSGYAALPTPTERLAEAPRQRIDLGWLRPVARPLARAGVAALLLGLVAAALQMVVPILTGIVIDDVLADRKFGLLHLVTLAMLGALAIGIGASMLQRLILARVAVRVDGEALDLLTQRLLRLPLDYFQTRTSVDIERRLSGMRQIRQILVEDGVRAITAATQLVAVVALMFVYSWVLALAFLAAMPLYGLLLRFSRTRLRPAFASLEESFSRYTGRQIDSIKGIETVKVMGAEPGLRRILLGEFGRLQDRLFRADLTVLAYDALIQAATLGLYVALLWAGALEVLAGHLSVGELVAYNTLVLLANPSLQTLLGFWDQLQHSSVLLTRLQDVFDAEPEQGADAAGLRAVSKLGGRVRLRRVGFAYPATPDRPVVQDVTLDIEPGTTVALVGRSGSGKSTLAKCIAGLMLPSSGTIEFDGIELRDMRLSELRRRIGFVLQDSYLFSDTIAVNIALGEEHPDPAAVRAAAEVADAAEFIERLPLGYNTQIGDSGMGLSGGQAQRIAIARAIYHRPPIVVLDEATSSLDAESERAVTENLQRLLLGRTAFVIAHRLSTIRSADLIAVLEQGRLVETGSHDELIARRGLYFHLHSQQLAD